MPGLVPGIHAEPPASCRAFFLRKPVPTFSRPRSWDFLQRPRGCRDNPGQDHQRL